MVLRFDLKCTTQPMGLPCDSGDASGMLKSRTIPSRAAPRPMFAIALAAAMAVAGAGVLVAGVSPGIGWALLVLGAGLASAGIDRNT